MRACRSGAGASLAVTGRLTALLQHACETVPYYGRAPGGIPADEVDLDRLPLLTKRAVQSTGSDICTDRLADLCIRKRQTSGTSGIPLTIAVDLGTIRAGWESFARHVDRLCPGLVDSGDPLYVLTLGTHAGSAREPERLPLPYDVTLVRAVLDPTARTDNEVEAEVERLAALQPMILNSRPTTLLAVVRWFERHKMRSPLSPAVVLTSGEGLTCAARSELETALGAPAYDVYGLAETGLVAYECPERTGLHVDEERFIVEVLPRPDLGLQGDAGEILLTDLDNVAMPIIRYRTGDLAALSTNPCACGSAESRLTELVGRVIYYFQAVDGSLYSPLPMARMLERCGLRQYQVVQRAPGHVELRYAAMGSPDLDGAVQSVLEVCGAGTRVDLTSLPTIEELSVKRSAFVSLVPDCFAT